MFQLIKSYEKIERNRPEQSKSDKKTKDTYTVTNVTTNNTIN